MSEAWRSEPPAVRATENRIAEICGTGAAGDAGAHVFADSLQRALAGGEAVPGAGDHRTAAVRAAIEDAARSSGLDVGLLRAVVAVESGGDALARSPAGARGLMQLMPATAAAYGVADRDDPGQNVLGGALYLRALLRRFGDDLRLALAAYNAGPAAVERYGGIPPFPETQRYVGAVLARYAGKP